MKTKWEHLQDLQEIIKQTNVHVMKVPEGGEKRKHRKPANEIAENLPSLIRGMNTQIQEAQTFWNRFNPKGSSQGIL